MDSLGRGRGVRMIYPTKSEGGGMMATRIQIARLFLVGIFLTEGFSNAVAWAASVETIAMMKSADRQKILVEGAKKEGKVTFYTGLIVDQLVRPLKDAFEKEYPFLQVDFFRGNSEGVAQRVFIEYQAK